MIWPRASAKLKIRPWIQKNMGFFSYMAHENPAVFFSTILGVVVGIPTCAYLVKCINEQPKGIAHQKVFYTIYRPEDYPKEFHQHCR